MSSLRLDSPHLPRIVSALLVCALGLESFSIVHANFWPAKPGARKAGPASRQAGHGAGLDLADVRRANLFGVPAGAENFGAVAIDPSLVLTGVIAADDPTQGMALVTDAQGKTAFLRVGESIPSGATLREVHADHILLATAAGFSTVYFKRGGGGDLSGNAYVPAVLANSPVFSSIVSAAPGIPPGTTMASRLALEREAHPPDLSQVPPPAELPPDQRPQKTR